MAKKSLHIIMTTFILALLSATAWPATYKCIDSAGRIEYRALTDRSMECTDMAAGRKPASKKPTNNDQQDSSNDNNNDANKDNDELQRLRDKVEALDKQKAEQEAAKTDAEKRAQHCETARANLTVLQSDNEVVRADEEGNKVVLDSEQREQAMRRTRKDIDYFCE